MALIMIVDDNSSFRAPTAAMLRSEGFETVCAATGQEALDSLKERLPDLILLDIAMPEMDGIACLKEIRRQFRTALIPVIMLTSMADSDMVIEASRQKVQGYLLKSKFSVGDLLEAIRRGLSRVQRSHTPEDETAIQNVAEPPAPEAAEPGPTR